MNNASDDSTWCENCRIRPQPVCGSLVDGDRLTSRGVAGDNSRENRVFDARMLKTDEGANALRFQYRLSLLNDLQPKLIVLAFKTLIFIMNPDQGNVAIPRLANS